VNSWARCLLRARDWGCELLAPILQKGGGIFLPLDLIQDLLASSAEVQSLLTRGMKYRNTQHGCSKH
jgi:hypothetical protein